MVDRTAFRCTSMATSNWTSSTNVMMVAIVKHRAGVETTLSRLACSRVSLITLRATVLLLGLENLVESLLLCRSPLGVLLRELRLQGFAAQIIKILWRGQLVPRK